MKRINSTIGFIFIGVFAALILCTTTASAQVSFKIDYVAEHEHYLVSLVAHETWEAPQNLTSTGQITIKVPHGDFDVYDVRNLQNGVNWEANSRFDAPTEAPEFDYISFGLATLGTAGLYYKAAEEIPLFTFKNAGTCTGAVALLNNQTDVFLPPNSRRANIGNQLTVLGAGGDAYVGNIEEGVADCALISSASNAKENISSIEVFPNPVKNELFVQLDWQQKGEDTELVVFNVLGKEVMNQNVNLTTGLNKVKLEVNPLESGAYVVKLRGKDWERTLSKFSKIK